MDINNLLDNDVRVNKTIDNIDINDIFKYESSIINEISLLEDKYKNIDLIYFNYNNIKNKIKKNINDRKDILIKLSIQKEDYNLLDKKQKLLYLKNEYNFYKEQTDTKKMINKIKNLHNKIDYLKNDVKNRKLSLEYNKIKEKYKDVLLFIKVDNPDIPKNLNTDSKIKWLNDNIEKLIEKQMMFDNYVFMLENYYNELIQKRILDINATSESV